MTFLATINGELLVGVKLHVPSAGPWFADCDFAENPNVSGRVSLAIGTLTLSGTIDPRYSGDFALQRRVRVVAGAGGWVSLLPARAYHSDAGITALSLAQDAAREAGEALGSTFEPAAARVGIDYVRASGPASRSLEQIIGGANWWVDLDGATQVGLRSTSTPSTNDYQVLEFDPVSRVVSLVLRDDDLSLVGIGSILSDERLDGAQTIRALEIELANSISVKAWTGGSGSSRDRLQDAFAALVSRANDVRLYGLYEYRVSRMSGERVELQAVSSEAGLPDILPISMWPGMAGLHAELTGGSRVLVQFIEGKSTRPVIVSFGGKDGASWAPSQLVLDAISTIKVGANATDKAAKDAPVNSQLDAINEALDAFAAAVPVSMDGGAALHTAFTAKWGPGLPPKASSNVGASKVRVE